jgi:hypothetical protein
MLGLPRVMIWRYENAVCKVPRLMDMALVGVAASLQQKTAAGSRTT